MKKRILSLCIALVLLCTMIPRPALAVEDADEAEIYTQYLLNGGYIDIAEEEIPKEYLDVSTCMIDIDKDGVSELLISLTNTEWSGPRGYPTSSVLLTIKNNTVQMLLSAYYGGGTMGGDYLVLKYDQVENHYVIALDGYGADGVNAIQSYLHVYSCNTFADEYVLDACRYSFYAGYYDAEIAKVRKQTDLYIEDETDFYFYMVNNKYVSQDDFNELSNRFIDPVDSSYQMYSGTYYAPIKGYSAEINDDSQSDSETESLEDNGYASAVQDAIDDMQVVVWGKGFGALCDVDGNGVEELFLIHHADESPDDDYLSVAMVCSVYTMSEGKVIPLIKKELLYYDAGSPWGYVGVIRKDGQIYVATTASNGSVWGTEVESGGFWTLYAFDGNALQQKTDLEYFCITDMTKDDAVLYDESSVTINGEEYGYSVYEDWLSGIEVLYAVYPWESSTEPQYENTMTLEDLLEYLKEHPVESIPDSVELKAYTAFPESTIGTEQNVKIQFSLYVNSELVPIEGYSLGISNPSVIESTETTNYNGSRIITFKGLNPGSSDLTFTENSTGTTITISVTVEDKCNYFRCSAFPIPYTYSGSIYVADYSCTVNENGKHDISFNAYNTSYAYGVVEVYDENGSLIKLVPLDPRSDGSGMEKVVNGFKWVWDDIKDLFDGDTPFYTKDSNAKHTPVKLDNIPENAEIVISSDGEVSDFATLYTGVDVFVRTVFAASSIDLKTDGQLATVKELMNALADSLIKSISHEETEKMIKQGLIKEATKSISTSIAFASSTDSISDIYETVYNLFQSLDIDAESIMLNVLKGMGYSVADAAFTTVVPLYKIVNFVDLILETAWPLVDYQFNLDRGRMEIHVTKHGLQNFVANSSVTVTQKSNFSSNTVLDAYVVMETDELAVLSDSIPEDITNYSIYSITLREDGVEVQPNEEIEVRMPIPNGVDKERCVVYRVEENGDLTLLESKCDGNYVTFTTSHLSYYIVGQTSSSPIVSSLVCFALAVGCIVFAVFLSKRKTKRVMVIALAVLAVALVGISLYSIINNASPNADANSHYQEESNTITIETTTETQMPEITEPETELPTEEPTEAPTETTVELPPLQYWIEYCDTQRLAEEDLETFGADECRLARNAIFAKSGRKFSDDTLQAYYEQFDWYHPTIAPDDFSNSMLNDVQSHNLDLIIAYEESRGYR